MLPSSFEATADFKALLKRNISQKLDKLGIPTEDDLVEYIAVLVINRRTSDFVRNELSPFLEDDTEAFVSWLEEWVSNADNLTEKPVEQRHASPPPEGSRRAPSPSSSGRRDDRYGDDDRSRRERRSHDERRRDDYRDRRARRYDHVDQGDYDRERRRSSEMSQSRHRTASPVRERSPPRHRAPSQPTRRLQTVVQPVVHHREETQTESREERLASQRGLFAGRMAAQAFRQAADATGKPSRDRGTAIADGNVHQVRQDARSMISSSRVSSVDDAREREASPAPKQRASGRTVSHTGSSRLFSQSLQQAGERTARPTTTRSQQPAPAPPQLENREGQDAPRKSVLERLGTKSGRSSAFSRLGGRIAPSLPHQQHAAVQGRIANAAAGVATQPQQLFVVAPGSAPSLRPQQSTQTFSFGATTQPFHAASYRPIRPSRPRPPVHAKKLPQASVLCRYFPNCKNPKCVFFHPIKCRFGDKCRNPRTCAFWHPPEQQGTANGETNSSQADGQQHISERKFAVEATEDALKQHGKPDTGESLETEAVE